MLSLLEFDSNFEWLNDLSEKSQVDRANDHNLDNLAMAGNGDFCLEKKRIHFDTLQAWDLGRNIWRHPERSEHKKHHQLGLDS